MFESMVIPKMLDGVGCCVLTAGIMEEMTTVYHRLIRSALHITPHTQRKHELTCTGLHPLYHCVDLKTLAHAGHVQRIEKDRLPKIVRDGALEGKNTPGRGHKTLAQCIKQSLARKKIEETVWKEIAAQKEQWRSKIREIGDGASTRITGELRKKIVAAWVLHPNLLTGRQILKQFTGGK
jgi:hypothetical protein